MADHHDLGREGEEMAAAYLQKKGYRILERNFRYQKAEVDILAKKDQILAAVEVKTRSSPYFGDPQDFVKKKQINLLVRAVDFFVNDKKLDVQVRFDIIAIIRNKAGMRIEHLEDAFLHL
jgi:putative endonuclease